MGVWKTEKFRAQVYSQNFREINRIQFIKTVCYLDEIFFYFLTVPHSVEITEIYSHHFLAKISWNQRIY